jgi:hypothetical protein
MNFNYKYPVTDFGEALNVLNPNVEPDIFKSQLYVNLDRARGADFLNRIFFQLGVDQDRKIFNPKTAFVKILLTGHRGSGKSVELKRMIHSLQNIYLPVYIDIEKQLIKLSAVEPEDIYQLLIIELMQSLAENRISFSEKNFRRITDLWFNERTVSEKNSTSYQIAAGSEAEAGINLYIFKLRTFLKSLITSQSEETNEVRRKIKANISDIINNLNAELSILEPELKSKGFNGFLFVLDGTEKLDYQLATRILIKDAPIFNQISASFIMASPVLGLYDIHGGQKYFNQQILPMVKLNQQNISEFKCIVTKRVDEATFFEPGILDCIAKKSGGSIRLLLELSYNYLLNKGFKKNSKEALEVTLYEMGLSYYRYLDKEHKEILESGEFNFGNEKVKEMLFGLILLAQNGDAIINPLVKPFLEGSKNYLCD